MTVDIIRGVTERVEQEDGSERWTVAAQDAADPNTDPVKICITHQSVMYAEGEWHFVTFTEGGKYLIVRPL